MVKVVIYSYIPFETNLFIYVSVKMRHVEDDSTIVWAIGPDSGVIAKHAKLCGEEVEMVVPFEGTNSAEVQYLPSCQAFFAFRVDTNTTLLSYISV